MSPRDEPAASKPADGVAAEARPSVGAHAGARASVWWFFLAVAVVEVIGHGVIVARVPDMQDWRDAAAFVRSEWKEGDAVTVAPAWADPLLRLVLGDLFDAGDAGRSDLAGYDRLWTMSIRGQLGPERAEATPSFLASFGRVTVIRQDLEESEVLYDFRERVLDARVESPGRGAPTPCPRRRLPVARPGGLASGPMWPTERFVCDPARPWFFVGPTVIEDLHLRPRACVWNHPAGPQPVRTSFADVPLGDRIVVHGGLYWADERERRHGPVKLAVEINGTSIGHLTHRDGDGWKRMVAEVPPSLRGGRGEVSFLVSAPKPYRRSFCWAASSREGP